MSETFPWEVVKVLLNREDVRRFERYIQRLEGLSEYVIKMDTYPIYHDPMIEWMMRPTDNYAWDSNPHEWASVTLHEDDPKWETFGPIEENQASG